MRITQEQLDKLSSLSRPAHQLLEWLAANPESKAWEESGLSGADLLRAYGELADEGMVHAVPIDPTQVHVDGTARRSLDLAAALVRVEKDPPHYVTSLIGQKPDKKSAALEPWREAAFEIENYRAAWDIRDTRNAWGNKDFRSSENGAHRLAVWTAIHAARKAQAALTPPKGAALS